MPVQHVDASVSKYDGHGNVALRAELDDPRPASQDARHSAMYDGK